MKTVGVTGGIGSGKSLVCRIFSEIGIPVYHADTAASRIMDEDPEIRRLLTELLGEEAYTGNRLNRKKVAGIVFQNPDKLAKVQEIVHPAVFKDFGNWKRRYNDVPYLVHEAAILFESGAYKLMDIILNVYAPTRVRIQRIMARDGLSEKEIRQRVENQWPESRRRSLSDFLIINDGKRMLLPQVIKIHRKLLTGQF